MRWYFKNGASKVRIASLSFALLIALAFLPMGSDLSIWFGGVLIAIAGIGIGLDIGFLRSHRADQGSVLESPSGDWAGT